MSELLEKPKVLCLGALAMDIVLESQMLPQNDGFALIESERLVPGGSSSNVSVALTLMGAEVYQTGQIGDDNLGNAFHQDLKLNGVHTEYLSVKKGGTTLHTYIITAPMGKHCIFANLGDAVNSLNPKDLPDHVLDGITCFYTDMFSSRASLWLAKKARQKGIPVVYNMQCVPSFMASCGVSREEIEEMLSLCTLFISGRDGYREMTGSEDPIFAMKKLKESFRMADGLICTAGDEGAYWLKGEEILTQKSFVIEPVDTTGAGDCFTAGIIFDFYCRQGLPEKALLFATGAAALKCMTKGPRSTADLAKIQDFIDKNNSICHPDFHSSSGR
ncbi:MAG: carbohydrate kinase family protein [Bacillota bacterium]|jgi:sugar/nucleoside kinase (ribokinase family)|nr:carbohydrate kinase family protein [Clostridia bacterium]